MPTVGSKKFSYDAAGRKAATKARATARKKKHPGFKAVSKNIQKKAGVSKKSADAILAASSRKASTRAKRANPRLRRVK